MECKLRHCQALQHACHSVSSAAESLQAQPYLIQVWQGFLESHELFMQLTAELAQKLKTVHILTQATPALSLVESAYGS